MLALTHRSNFAYAPMPSTPVAVIGLGSPDVNIGFRTTWGLLSLVSAILGGYHAYKRYGGDAGWTIGWALGGAVFPIITPIVALIQGYGQPRHGKGFGRKRRGRYRRAPMRHYRRRGLHGHESRRRFFQDGRDFYDEDSGKLIVSYPSLVKNDYDMEGAKAARAKFLRNHPEYRD